MKTRLFLLILFYSFLIQKTWSQDEAYGNYNLMPWPNEIKSNSAKFRIDSNITISIKGENHPRVRNAAINFLRRLANRTGVFIDHGFPLKEASASIEISFDRISNLTIDGDESYSLLVKEDKVTIHAPSDVGALRGLETLLQLVSHNENSYFFQGVTIQDAPRFVWRGLMIDVSRHFQPVSVIKRNLDAMASVKLNVFHWHLTDDQGFRIESKVYPKLQELASDGLYYTQEQIKDVVSYASNLGIRVIPELDVPGHASAILTAYPEYGSKDDYPYSIERFAGVFDPTLNPTKESTYEFLDNLFSEISPLFPDEYFHIGGDENEGKHWDENKSIQNFKKQHNLKTNHDLQTYFNIKLEKILNRLGKKLMGWDEIMTPNMPTTAVIHSWRGENEGLPKGGSLISAAKKGYQTVLSNGYYIDRMLSVEHHYSIDPIGDVELTKEEQKRILGGEATMWSELVTPLTIDSRIWPRTAAIAERFWSPKAIDDVDDMLRRLNDINKKLEELGITHLKNRDVILRNLNDNEDNAALKTLSRLCEPLKVYSRNAGGTEYKSFSPFTLFADACIADAEYAVRFNKNVGSLINNSSKDIAFLVKNDLENWSKIHEGFSKLHKSPNTSPLEPLSRNLSKASGLLFETLSNKKITPLEHTKLENLLTALEAPFMDTELAIVASLKNLLKYCRTNYLIPE
jgi:hexosaminidase